jgi:hypothetical protein
MKLKLSIILFLLITIAHPGFSQMGTIANNQVNYSTPEVSVDENVFVIADTTKPSGLKKETLEVIITRPRPNHDPRIATRRSLIFPGLGQIYNKEYWKLPIVYGALSIPTITFFYNNTWYKRTKFAFEAKYAFNARFDTAVVNPPTAADSSNYLSGIDPRLKNLSAGTLQNYRNIFRRDRDYSVLWFLIVWGVNVVDATVFAHLKQFDVSDNLSLRVKPSINPLTKNNEMKLVFSLKKPTQRIFSVK